MLRGRRRLGAAFLVCAVLLLLAVLQWRTRPPPLADEAEILAIDADQPVLRRFADNPVILVIVFDDLAAQGAMLNRIAALVEKSGLPRDRVLSGAETESAIAADGATPATWYYGHDYSFADLRRFRDLASRAPGGLTAAEQRLVAMLEPTGALAPAAMGGLITLPRRGLDPLLDEKARATILRHELSHGEFFANPAFAAYVARFWHEGLSAAQRAAFSGFLGHEGYDEGNETLIANEAQAYLVHTDDPRYFNARAAGLPEESVARLRAEFIAAMPPGWLRTRDQRPRRRRQRGTVSSNTACPERPAPPASAASRAARRLRK